MLSKRTPQTPDNFSRYRAAKASTTRPRRVRESSSSSSSRSRHAPVPERRQRMVTPPDSTTPTKRPTSPVIMLRVGPEQRLFAAHESILIASPFFAEYCEPQTPSPLVRAAPQIQHPGKRIELPDESPEVLSAILEFLYKGDYYPRLRHNARRRAWELEDARADGDGNGNPGATVYHHRGGLILRDTAIYCAAEKYNLPTLQRLALRKQGLQTGIDCSTILASARYAYANTPETESKLRAHYLALIIRSRGTFKRSGTMQVEMERGGRLFFDLFVAMCNHMDDDLVEELSGCSGSLRR
ncbi:hypothetical protein N7481_000928 [Penicillium waksmanii]|uniref:uncharacterized protein n=1 Tax=Penicillium waksmanii TaxID=69791 RepID=UPI002547F47B|nr:uncharacterized protein N7481_000928 [Penicillium waksmanii]KAJ6000519.1 hypothetical protein N7481_000928 [Penicillium waksmanii]